MPRRAARQTDRRNPDKMSYCVNCGVELEKSEPRCPLCATEVVNPAEPRDESAVRPYSRHIERIDKRIDRRYIASFLSLLLLIPLFTAMFCNLLFNGMLSWSLYVAGGELLFFAWLLFPMIAPKLGCYAHIGIAGAACCALLWLIERMSGGGWLITLGLPLAALATGYAEFLAWLCTPRCRLPVLIRCSLGLTGAGLLVVGIEFFIGLSRQIVDWPRWSMFALIPCLVLASSLLLLNRRARLKDEIRRRFYM